MKPLSDLAIVLKVIPYNERDQIVTALTEHYGQISALAKNSIHSRRFGGSLDLFVASQWHFTAKPGAHLFHLSQTEVREPFDSIRKHLDKLTVASIFSELMLKVSYYNPEEVQGENSDLFRLHSNALATLHQTQQTGIEVPLLNAYIVKLLQWSGNQPRLQNCFKCGIELNQLPPQIALHCFVANANWICTNCFSSLENGMEQNRSSICVSALALQDFLISSKTPMRQAIHQWKASTQEHRDLFKFSEALYTYHIPGFEKKPLKALRFLNLITN